MAEVQWEVKSTTKNKVTTTTAVYKVDGTAVATITGLKAGLLTNNGTNPGTAISGITVNDATGTIGLDASVFDKQKVAISSSKYSLGFVGVVPQVKIQDTALSYAVATVSKKKVGTAAVKGTLTEGYTLAANAKSITYSPEKTNQTLATVSGLATGLETKDGTIVKKAAAIEPGANGEESEETPAAAAVVSFEPTEGTITLANDALTASSVTLKLANGANYSLAVDDDVKVPVVAENGTWSSSKKGTATYTATNTAGYTLSLDGKVLNYTAAHDTAAALFTVSGVNVNKGQANITGLSVSKIDQPTVNYGTKVTVSNEALTASGLSVGGAGYQLALDQGVQQEATEANTWGMKKNTAYYKKVQPAYYVYDNATNKVLYNKQVDKQTLATVSNVNNKLVASGQNLVTAAGAYAITVDDTTFTVADNALIGKNVKLTDSSNGGYKFELNSTSVPATVNEVWSVSGTVATLKGNVTTPGYVQNDDTTITYAAKKNNVVLATVKGLAKGLGISAKKTAGNNVGTSVKKADGTNTFVPGLVKNGNELTLSKNALGTTNVTLTSGSGFNYSFKLDNSAAVPIDYDENDSSVVVKEVIKAVPQEAVDRTFWETTTTSTILKDGKEAYYTLTDGKTVTYNEPVIGEQVASLSNLRSGLTPDSNYDIDGITIDKKNIILSSKVLDRKTVGLSGSQYGLKVEKGLEPKDTTGWNIVSDVAYLKPYTSEGYTISGKQLTYSPRNLNTGTLAEVHGLKSGLAVKADDGSINGIIIGTWEDTDADGTADKFTPDTMGKTIQLGKAVLTSRDVTLSDAAVAAGYNLTTSGVAVSKVTPTWSINTRKGLVTCKVTTSAGYLPAENGSSVAYNKKSTVSFTLTGLDITNMKVEDGQIEGITLDGTTVTVAKDLFAGNKITISGGNYTLALAEDMTAPELSPTEWTVTPNKKTKLATATLSGEVTKKGYTLSADGKTITYFEETNSGASVANGNEDPDGESEPLPVIATITGLKYGIESGESIPGITVDSANKKITLTSDVLTASKVTITGGDYKLALDDNVLKKATETTEWVTSGTTATYKKYNQAYYTPDAAGSSIAYTAATKGTTYATIKGIKSGADLNENNPEGVKDITLNKDQLGASNVTLTGTGYSLKLGDAPTSAENVEEWVTSGTTATYKNYSRGYYTKSSNNKITYTAPTKGTTIATIKGIKSGADLNENNGKGVKEITLKASQLGTTNVTITGDGYTLDFAKDVAAAEQLENDWITTEIKNKKKQPVSVTATYRENFSEGYTLADNKKSITYSSIPTSKTLATIAGLALGTKVETEPDDETGEEISTGKINGIDVDGSKIILSNSSLFPDNEEPSNAKLTLTSTAGYTLDIDGEELQAPEIQTESAEWTLNTKKGIAVYKADVNSGYAVAADGKSITHTKDLTGSSLVTVSGLNTTTLKKFEDTTIKPGEFRITADEDGETESEEKDAIIVDTDAKTVTLTDDSFLTKKVTLGKNDNYAFAFDGITEPKPYEAPKWIATNVKKANTTTATLKDGIEAGYVLLNDKTVALQAEQAGDTLLTITGLKKGLAVSTDRHSIGVKVDGEVVNGIDLSTGTEIGLDESVLGTSDITLTGEGYTLVNSFTPPGEVTPAWTFSGGTAVYANRREGGFTISKDAKSATYTPTTSTTIATVKGLKATYDGNVNNDGDLLADDYNNVISVGKNILGTTKVTVTVPKNSTAYTLALQGGIPEEPTTKTSQWVTSGTTAQLKDYATAYYKSTGNAIVYYPDKNTKVYATLKGIKSGAQISDDNKVITLSKAQLAESNVSLSGSGYSLQLDADVPKEAATGPKTEWVTNGANAVYKTYTPGYYAFTKSNVLAYKATPNAPAAVTHASIAGVVADINATPDNNNTFTISGNGLSKKVTLSGGGNASVSGYNFKLEEYNYATITGSANADDITVDGTMLYVSTGNGKDKVTVTDSGVSVVTGAGDDTIDASESSGNNLFIFAQKQGDDVIQGFTATDSIKISGGAKYLSDGEDVTIQFTAKGGGSVILKDAAKLGKITVNGTKVTPTTVTASNVLLEDSNYSADAAQLSSIVQPHAATYTPYDFDSGLNLTKEDKTFATDITYAKDDK